MKKLLLAAVLLSTNAMADSHTYAKINDDKAYTMGAAYRDMRFDTYHEVDVSNLTDHVVSVSVCYDIVACPEYEQWLRNMRDCKSIALQPMQTFTEKKHEFIVVNYPVRLRCHLLAQTETTGATPSKSTDIKEFWTF